MSDNISIEEELVSKLKNCGFHLSAAESCTGGMLISGIIGVSGASDVIEESYITYSDRVKHKLLGVSEETLKKYTAVSAETADEMLTGCAERSGSECVISVTGYAGPSAGDDGTPAGTVYIGCKVLDSKEVEKYHFDGDRQSVREQASKEAVKKMIKMLDTYKHE